MFHPVNTRPTPTPQKARSPMGRLFAGGMMIMIALGVMLFLGKHSLNFFTWTFQADDNIYAWLGLLLTSIGAVGWLLDFLYMADTDLRRTVAITMTAISLLGELAAAGFDMYVSALGTINIQMSQTDIRNMTLVVALLGFVHGIALVVYVAGDEIGAAWQGKSAPILADPRMPIIPAPTERKYPAETSSLRMTYPYPPGQEPEQDKAQAPKAPFHSPAE